MPNPCPPKAVGMAPEHCSPGCNQRSRLETPASSSQTNYCYPPAGSSSDLPMTRATSWIRLTAAAVLLAAGFVTAPRAADPAFSAADLAFFDREVKPVLE